MAKPLILAHDIGTSGSKSSLVDVSGAIVASCSTPQATNHGPGGVAEQDAEDWWAGVCRNTRKLFEERPGDRGRVAAIGLSGQMLGLLAIDAAGRPLAPSMIHSDSRASEEAAIVAKQIGAERIYRITGNVMDARSPLCKLLWFKRNRPGEYARAHRFLQSKDFIAGRLIGTYDSTDYSDACHAQWLDISRAKYDESLFAALGLSVKKLPRPRAAVEVIGSLSKSAAEALGLASGIPVVAGGGDGACATAGAGAIARGETYCCIGTSAWIASVADAPFIDEKRRLFNLTALDGKTYGTYGTVQAAGRAVGWVMEVLGQKDFKRFDQMIASVVPGCEGLTFLPYLEGERSPIWDADARGVFFGITPTHGQAHMLRAAVEGVSFALSSVLQAIRENREIPAMRLIGGGAQSAVWQQILADACDVEVQILSVQAADATGLGAALAAGVGTGIFRDFSEATAGIRISQRVAADRRRAKVYARHRALYEKIYSALKPVFADLRKMIVDR